MEPSSRDRTSFKTSLCLMTLSLKKWIVESRWAVWNCANLVDRKTVSALSKDVSQKGLRHAPLQPVRHERGEWELTQRSVRPKGGARGKEEGVVWGQSLRLSFHPSDLTTWTHRRRELLDDNARRPAVRTRRSQSDSRICTTLQISLVLPPKLRVPPSSRPCPSIQADAPRWSSQKMWPHEVIQKGTVRDGWAGRKSRKQISQTTEGRKERWAKAPADEG
jgi:hypothetical protein